MLNLSFDSSTPANVRSEINLAYIASVTPKSITLGWKNYAVSLVLHLPSLSASYINAVACGQDDKYAIGNKENLIQMYTHCFSTRGATKCKFPH